MNQTDIGKFIAECRKEKQLTQVQLAEMLNITDRAVSKWETGKSMPDSSIMLELCEILGITVNELLSGEKINREDYDKKAEENLIALKRKDENNIKKNVIIAIIFSLPLFVGMTACIICDIALSGNLTWSLIPVSSILFAWIVFFPTTILGKKGIPGSLISLSVFLIPYLYILNILVKVRFVFSIGAVMSIIFIVYLWLVFALFHRLRHRKSAAAGTAVLLAIPFTVLINLILVRFISGPVIDVWDIFSTFVLLIIAFAFFISDYVKNKSAKSQ